MKDVTDRIIKRVNDLKISQKEIAKAIGASSPTVNNWLNYDREPSLKYLEKLAKTLEVSIQWLVTGYELDNNILDENTKISKAPILSLYEIKDFYKHLITNNNEKREYKYFVNNSFSEEVFWIRAKTDNSMFPIFNTSDLILIDTKREPKTGNCVIAVLDDDTEAILRKFRICYDEKANKEYYQLIAENNFYPEIDSRRSKFQIKGVAVKHERYLV